MLRNLSAAAFAVALVPAVYGQGAAFQTPGMPSTPSGYAAPGSSGQADRFSNVFNPAFSFVVDSIVDSIHSSGDSEDGEAIELRSLELAGQSWVDPDAWAYFVAATDGESLSVEEAAVHYRGFGGHSTLRAGRFFVDFGKQMQTHIHELRTLERPLALRTFLGDEVKGDGLQWDSWSSIGDNTAVRWSIGAFASLLPETSDDFDPTTTAERSVSDRKHFEDFGFTARLTGFSDVSENGVLQLGASARVIPSFAYSFEPSGSEARSLNDTVLGLDATYGWTNETGLSALTLGGEYLVDTGDTYSKIDDAGTPADASDDVVDPVSDNLQGYYVFADWMWDKNNNVGLQYSRVDLPQTGTPSANEVEAYYTRMLSEFHRVRFVVAATDFDESEDSVRFAIQYSAFVGAHGHGVNW